MTLLTLPYTVKISGQAGEGVICTGEMLLDALSRYGFYGAAYREFPSNIQGGYSAVTIQISDKSSGIPAGNIDFLFIRFTAALEKEIRICNHHAFLMFDSTQCKEDEINSLLKKLNRTDIQLMPVPLMQTGSDSSRKKYYSAEVLGVVGRFLSVPADCLEYAVRNQFKGKDGSKIQKDIQMVTWGYQIQSGDTRVTLPLPHKETATCQLLDGNEAVARGAVAAGCAFFSSYPITPSTGIGNVLAKVLPCSGGVSWQAEDEIAAIGAAIGASFAGVKSMTATSGPGLSLMQEFLGYASMVEIPLVIVDVQRPGPSTGSPAQFAQEDLFAAVFGSHGETSRIVLAPDSIEGCYHLAIEAFNCAEHYQCPVIILSDSVLGLTKGTVQLPDYHNSKIINRLVFSGAERDLVDRSDEGKTAKPLSERPRELNLEEYKRYSLDSETTPVPVPGRSPVAYRVTGLEHDEHGVPTDDAEMRTRQQLRRMNKISTVETMFSSLVEWDCATSDVDFGMIAWGMTASVAKTVVDRLRSDGFRVAAVYPRLLFPVCTNAIRRLLSMTNTIIIPESNGYGQYARLLRMYTEVKPYSVLLTSGSPFHPDKMYDECIVVLKRCLDRA